MDARIPSWLWRIVLACSTDNIGEKGTRTVLRRSQLEQFIGVTPEDEDTPSITIDEYSRYIEALFDIFGEDGARPVLLRSGKIGFISAYERMPPTIKVARKMLKVLSKKRRLLIMVREFNEAFNHVMGTHGIVTEEENGKVIVEIPSCPHCKGIFTEKPACFVEVGLLSQLIETAVGDEYTVKETTCIARKDHVCRFEIEKG